MKLLFFVLVINILVVSCSSKNDKDDYTIDDNQSKNTIEQNTVNKEVDTTFFLGFKPEFSEEEFQKQIVIENRIGNMNGNLFSISVDYWKNFENGGGGDFEEILDFKVSQSKNHIILDYKEINENLSLTTLTKESSNHFNSYLTVIDSLRQKFMKKYKRVGHLIAYPDMNSFYGDPNMKKKVKEFFIKRNLSQERYDIFKGNSKTILLGTKFGHGKETGFNEVNAKLNKIKAENPLEYDDGFEVFRTSLKEYQGGIGLHKNAQYIPDKYYDSRSRPSSIETESGTLNNNAIALLFNDLARLRNYKTSSLNYYFDCQIIYMTNVEFYNFDKKWKSEYIKLVTPVRDKTESDDYEKKQRQKEMNAGKL